MRIVLIAGLLTAALVAPIVGLVGGWRLGVQFGDMERWDDIGWSAVCLAPQPASNKD